MNEKLIVILNPKSGSSGDDFRAAIEKALQERGMEFEVRETTLEISGGQLAQEAIAEGATHLLACGGDGTVMSVVNGVGKTENPNSTDKNGADKSSNADKAYNEQAENPESRTRNPEPAEPHVTLSIIPGGTANLLATALKIPTDVEGAIATAVAGEDRVIDLGRCGEHLFALGVGIGLTERLVSQASTEQKEAIGRWAYALAMLKELGAQPHTFTLKRDDKKAHQKSGVAVVIANAGEIGGKMKFAPDALMDDGLIDVCILHRFYVRDVLSLLWSTLRGQVRVDRAVSFYQAHRVEIGSNPPLDLQIDGEVVDLTTPLVAEVVPRALRVRVPVTKSDDPDLPEPREEPKEEVAQRRGLMARARPIAAILLAGALLIGWRRARSKTRRR